MVGNNLSPSIHKIFKMAIPCCTSSRIDGVTKLNILHAEVFERKIWVVEDRKFEPILKSLLAPANNLPDVWTYTSNGKYLATKHLHELTGRFGS